MRVNVIIPVFNNEIYVENCVNSVLKQDYSHVRIILVNDGSTDNSGAVCSAFAEKNENVVLINNEKNYGVSHARNQGIDFVLNNFSDMREMIMFLDSDDFYCENCISDYVNRAKQTNAKIVISSAEYVNNRLVNYPKLVNKDNISPCEAIKFLTQVDYPVTMCVALYDAKLFESIRLNERLKYFEDLDVNIKILNLLSAGIDDFNSKIEILHQPYYNYTSNNYKNRPFYMEHFLIFDEIERLYDNKEISREVYGEFLNMLVIYEICALAIDVEAGKELIGDACDRFQVLAKEIKRQKLISNRWYHRILLISISPRAYIMLMRWKNYSAIKRRKKS